MNSNCPVGTANDPNAPWNDVSPENLEFNVTVSQSLSKNVTVTTNDYTQGEIYSEKEWDGESYCTVTYEGNPDTSDTNWRKAYKEEHDTPLYLINLFKAILEDKMNIEDMREERRKYLIKECSNWIEDDFAVCKD